MITVIVTSFLVVESTLSSCPVMIGGVIYLNELSEKNNFSFEKEEIAKILEKQLQYWMFISMHHSQARIEL